MLQLLVLAAHRAGIRRILLPARNEADIEDIPDDVRKELEVVLINRIGEVLDSALEVLVANPPPPLVQPPVGTDNARQTEPETISVKPR